MIARPTVGCLLITAPLASSLAGCACVGPCGDTNSSADYDREDDDHDLRPQPDTDVFAAPGATAEDVRLQRLFVQGHLPALTGYPTSVREPFSSSFPN